MHDLNRWMPGTADRQIYGPFRATKSTDIRVAGYNNVGAVNAGLRPTAAAVAAPAPPRRDGETIGSMW
jgi:hypothetical protein